MMTPIVPAPETVRQENREFQDSLGNIVRLCQTKDAQPVIVIIIIIINRFFSCHWENGKIIEAEQVDFS
jgi:hypothetical protein